MYGKPIWSDRLINAFADGEILMNKDKHFKIEVYQKAPSKTFMYYHEKDFKEYLYGTIVECGGRLKCSIIRDAETKQVLKESAKLFVTESNIENVIRLLGWTDDDRFWFKFLYKMNESEITMYPDNLLDFINVATLIK